MTRRPYLVVLHLLLTLALATAARAQAARIDGISPAMAKPGEQVTITGIGFGGPNVQITVGAVRASLVSATGNSATFIVPDGARIGLTTVTATNPGGNSGSIPFRVLLRLTVDAAAAAQATIGADGGTLRATRSGTTFELFIPPGALDTDTTISLAPVVAIANLPFSGGVVTAAQFEPSGLKLHRTATLTITLPASVPVTGLLGFLVDDLGLGLEVDGAEVEGSTVTVPVDHFTAAGGGVGALQDFQQQVLPLLNALSPSLPPSQVDVLTGLVRAWIEPDSFGFAICTQTDLCKRVFDIAVQSLTLSQQQACSAAQTLIQDGEPFLAYDAIRSAVNISSDLLDISQRAEEAQVPGFDLSLDLTCVTNGLHGIVDLAASQALANPRAGLLGLMLDVSRDAQLLGSDDESSHAVSTLASVVTTLLNRADQTCQADPDAGENLLDLLLHAFGATPQRNEDVLNSLDSGLADRVHDTRAGCRIRITPLAPQATLQKTVQFTGFAVGLQARDLFWSIDSDALGSTIDRATGLFTAGQTIGTVTIKGTSIVEPDRFKRTTVTIVDSCSGSTAALFDNRLRSGPFVDDDDPPVCIVVDPPVATVMASHKQQFTAIVTGGTDQRVDWSVTGNSQITSDGLVTAGQTAGTVTVRAQSVVDPSVFGEATLTIVPQPPPDPTFVPLLQGHYHGGSSFPFTPGGVPADVAQNCATKGGVVMMQGTFDYHSDTGQLTGSFPIDNSTVHFTQYTSNTIIMTLGGAPAFCGEITIAGIIVRGRFVLDSVSIGMTFVGP